ncbi:hypothetical protein [uncultured Porphyromonas sp.]|uniref:hypothetical protein n=1 Tax=uncultured Porphyromonas sp. TaxID=159274 RepID=UPI00258D1A64|nr:hypothetical protein [uncultured Porphyromonas sp.]
MQPRKDLSEVLFSTDKWKANISKIENPEGVLWPNNPSFPLKVSDSEPEGEAWVARTPQLIYPEGVAYTQVRVNIKVQPLRGS